MLEIKDLVKVYKTKGGAEVRALDGVSVSFEEKGMVFLLGKSGSGKSTLLNLCGGLDSPDSGEIVIKGRSSKDFTQSDFDSYRNTFVGFVFQEYNILNEFTVEDNIALALELQGKNKDKKRVREILEQVEMETFAKRKPNTLSGGQKQRIAIARALVKNPEIIMADEPTGALDSNTGKQVFDTLKKLSEEKLVIVVSHDREFAEIYGDRIIELKDGKIISDVTKTKIAATQESENVSFIGSDTISVKSGAKLTDADLQKIRNFLTLSQGDVIISNGKEEIQGFKKAARIDENGARESFKETKEEEIQKKKYTADESRFIRSKLPARHAIRIGASGMKVKPFRLFFTILLSFIAFTMFGLFSTLTFYDEKSVAAETYATSGYTSLQFQKRYLYTYTQKHNGEVTYSYESTKKTKFTPADLAAYGEKYGETVGIFDYAPSDYYLPSITIQNASRNNNSNYYQNPKFNGFAAVSGETTLFEILAGGGLGELGDDDVMISSYLYDSLQFYGLMDAESGEKIELQANRYEDIVGKQLRVSSEMTGTAVTLTVRGVFRCDPPAKYDELKEENQTAGNLGTNNSYYMQQELEYDFYYTALVNENFYAAHEAQFASSGSKYIDYKFESLHTGFQLSNELVDDFGEQFIYGGVYQIGKFSSDNIKPDFYFYGSDKTSLSDGEIIVSFNALRNYYQTLSDDKARKIFDDALAANPDDWENAEKLQREYSERANKYLDFLSRGYYESYFIDENDDEQHVYEKADAEDYAAALAEMQKLFDAYSAGNEYPWNGNVTLSFYDNIETYGTYKVVGFFYGTASEQNSQAAYFADGVFESIKAVAGYEDYDDGYEDYEETKYVEPEDAIYSRIAIAFPDRSVLSQILNGENVVDETDDTLYTLYSYISESLAQVNMMLEMFEQIFLWVGVVMAVFAVLLLFNFISVSISYKKKEIGILRAVGARSADVFKIFYSESTIISGICFVLAMIASFVACYILNTTLAAQLGAAIFVFGPLSWLVLLGIAVVTSFIATFLPVYGIAKRKPVESIRAL